MPEDFSLTRAELVNLFSGSERDEILKGCVMAHDQAQRDRIAELEFDARRNMDAAAVDHETIESLTAQLAEAVKRRDEARAVMDNPGKKQEFVEAICDLEAELTAASQNHPLQLELEMAREANRVMGEALELVVRDLCSNSTLTLRQIRDIAKQALADQPACGTCGGTKRVPPQGYLSCASVPCPACQPAKERV